MVKNGNDIFIMYSWIPGAVTLAKLRFQSSTANNARTKNNEPNPNQQYFRFRLFQLKLTLDRIIVTLLAQSSGNLFEISARMSEKIIVRGQNPGIKNFNTILYVQIGRYTSKVKQQPSTPTGPNMSTVTNILPPITSSSHFTWPGPGPVIKPESTTTVFRGKVGVNTENPQVNSEMREFTRAAISWSSRKYNGHWKLIET